MLPEPQINVCFLLMYYLKQNYSLFLQKSLNNYTKDYKKLTNSHKIMCYFLKPTSGYAFSLKDGSKI